MHGSFLIFMNYFLQYAILYIFQHYRPCWCETKEIHIISWLYRIIPNYYVQGSDGEIRDGAQHVTKTAWRDREDWIQVIEETCEMRNQNFAISISMTLMGMHHQAMIMVFQPWAMISALHGCSNFEKSRLQLCRGTPTSLGLGPKLKTVIAQLRLSRSIFSKVV